MSTTLFKNGNIASSNSKTLSVADVLVEDGKIKAVGQNLSADGAAVIDCQDKIVLPALFDIHVHFREPGQEDKETIETGALAALTGGVTGVIAMPNTRPPIDSAAMVRLVNALAESAIIPVLPCACITKDRAGTAIAEIAEMAEQGAVMLSDDGSPVDDPYVLRRAMEYARDFDLTIASHCETMSLSGDGAMNEGRVSYALGIPATPACSEEICIDRDARIAQLTGAKLHIQHLTTARGLEIVKRFKDEGVNITCEVSPHHLIFNEDDIEKQPYDTNLKMNPPLRTAGDNKALLEGLLDGSIDLIATDHAPHTRSEKGQDFASAPFGIIGLETALISLYHHFIKPGTMRWDILVERFSERPRKMIKRDTVEIKEGNNAELIVFDPNGETLVDESFLKSKSNNSPFINQTLQGRINYVYCGEALHAI